MRQSRRSSPFERPPWLGWAALIGGLVLALASATLQHAVGETPAAAADLTTPGRSAWTDSGASDSAVPAVRARLRPQQERSV